MALKLQLLHNDQSSIMGTFLWSSGQSSWLQIQKPGFDSRRYVVHLASRVHEELIERKSSGSGLKKKRYYGRRGSAALTNRHPSIRKSLH
jgi:hypothetical protein